MPRDQVLTIGKYRGLQRCNSPAGVPWFFYCDPQQHASRFGRSWHDLYEAPVITPAWFQPYWEMTE